MKEIKYSLGWWDAGDGYREHTLTEKDFEATGMCEYLGDIYVEYELPEYQAHLRYMKRKYAKTRGE